MYVYMYCIIKQYINNEMNVRRLKFRKDKILKSRKKKKK